MRLQDGAPALPLTPWEVSLAQKYAGLSQQLPPSPARKSCTQDPSHPCTRLVLSHACHFIHTHTCTRARLTVTPHTHAHPCSPHTRAHFLHILVHTHSPHNRQHLHTQTETDRRRGEACQEPPGCTVARPGRLPRAPSLLPAQALYLALRCRLQLLGRQFRIHLPSVGHWRLGPGRPWG